MKTQNNQHPNYEVLNLIGYGLAKFDNAFIKQFNFKTKTDFYKYCLDIEIAETVGTIKNRMDLFDPFFDNGRRGWWQKGEAYIHRKILIDSLFGNEDVENYANIVKLYLKENYKIGDVITQIKPILKSRFAKLQKTGLEAELFFIQNFQSIDYFRNGKLEDARLYGDGYDFQIDTIGKYYLAEIKGIREKKGRFRMTEKEYEKAKEYSENYIVIVVLNLNDIPYFINIFNPIKNLSFKEEIRKTREIKEYHLISEIC